MSLPTPDDSVSSELSSLIHRLAPLFVGKEPAWSFEERCEFFAFNVTDWIGDLRRVQQLFEAPGKFSEDDAYDILFGLVHHGWYHLASAARLAGLEESPICEDLKVLQGQGPK